MDHQSIDGALKRRFRVRKEDSAYVYAILESYDGICTTSTLNHQSGDLFRDLELQVSLSHVTEVGAILARLRTELSGHLIDLP